MSTRTPEAITQRIDGTVVEVHGMLVTVQPDAPGPGEPHPERLRARPPRDRTTPVIGDRCVVEVAGAEARVVELAPRERTFERLSLPRQTIATHVDHLLIVQAVDPGPRPGLVDRMWSALDDPGRARGGEPHVDIVIVLNKCDLPGADEAAAMLADHVQAGAQLVRTSTRTGEGLDALRALLGHGTSVLVGHSGVGKSSLVNALVPAAGLAVGHVNALTAKGRHTTTVATCHVLGEGLVVDTPGVRAFPLEALPLYDLARRFPGFGGLAETCHFGRCLHEAEPGCAVREAPPEEVPPERLARWDALLAVLREEAAARRGSQPERPTRASKVPPPRHRR